VCTDERSAASRSILGRPINQPDAHADPIPTTAALAFVRGRPEFIDSDIDEDGVWAIFVHTVPLMLLFNREPDPIAPNQPLSREQKLAATEVPDSSTAMLINTLGVAFADETPFIKPLLQGNGYSTIVDPGTVESLRAFNDDGVFYMSAPVPRILIAHLTS
jgi:hypothetical protein